MKKSLIALAVFGAFSGAALADGSNVQLYGIIDAGVTHYTGLAQGTGTTSSTGLSSGGQSPSRIGVKGTEDLGGGLSALFQVETGFCSTGTNMDGTTADTTAKNLGGGYCSGGGFMQRLAIVGVKGDFGTVTAGRMYTALFDAEAAMDPFGYGLTGNIANLSLTAHAGTPASVGGAVLQRFNQAVEYVSPSLSGFTGKVVYSFAPSTPGTVPTATVGDVTRAYELQGQYANGPITAGLGYHVVTNVEVNPNGNDKLWNIYGAYDFGVAKVSAIYEKLTRDNITGDQKFWMLGATVPVGPGAILASYSQNKDTLSGLTGADAKAYALGYTYSLSKQTNLYASYAHVSNDVNTKFVAAGNDSGLTGQLNQSSSGFAVGIRHQF